MAGSGAAGDGGMAGQLAEVGKLQMELQVGILILSSGSSINHGLGVIGLRWFDGRIRRWRVCGRPPYSSWSRFRDGDGFEAAGGGHAMRVAAVTRLLETGFSR